MPTVPKLENSCVVAVRDLLLHGNSNTFHEHMKRATSLKGGNELYVFEDWLFRDIIGYSMIHYFFMFNGTVFGGFIPAHYSGLPWTDLDIMFPSKVGVDSINGLPDFLNFLLGIERYCIRMRQHSHNNYGVTYDITVNATNEHRVTIKVDICLQETIKNMPNKLLPVTIGSCLQMDKHGNTIFRSGIDSNIDRRLQCWTVHSILTLLKKGSDIKFAFHQKLGVRMTDRYREYYWYRIHKKMKYWNLLPVDGKEPVPYPAEQLDILIKRITQINISRAA